MEVNAQHEVESVARESYGRLLAWLVSRCRDIAAAEDALADALLSAIQTWSEQGTPKNPEAWLLAVARRRLIDRYRRDKSKGGAEEELQYRAQLRLHQEAAEAASVPFRPHLPDRRLELLFVCAHPRVPENMRTPLMLQAVLGLTAAQIGSLMLLPPTTVGKRLVRLKQAIAKEVPFEIPEAGELPQRLRHVLDAVYAAYGAGWESAADLGGTRLGLAAEAVWLAALLVRLMPQSAEAKGLYALLCFCESRRDARRSSEGEYVPLEEQDTTLWDPQLIETGEKALWLASQLGQPGSYQTEAAIHSVHAHRAVTGSTDWSAIALSYRFLAHKHPSFGAQIGYAASLGRQKQAAAGLAVLDSLPEEQSRRHQPYWAVRAWLLRQAEHWDAARSAYQRAIGLCEDSAVRAWLIRQRDTLAISEQRQDKHSKDPGNEC